LQKLKKIRWNWHWLKGAHSRPPGISDRQLSRQRADRCKKQSEDLAKCFAPIALPDGETEHCAVNGEMEAPKGLRNNVHPFKMAPGKAMIS